MLLMFSIIYSNCLRFPVYMLRGSVIKRLGVSKAQSTIAFPIISRKTMYVDGNCGHMYTTLNLMIVKCK